MRCASLFLLLVAAAAVVSPTRATDAPAPDAAFLVVRKTAGPPEAEGRTVVGRGVDIAVEVFNAGSKCVESGGVGECAHGRQFGRRSLHGRATRANGGGSLELNFPLHSPHTHTRPATAVEIADVMPPADLFDVTGETSLKLER